MSSGVWNKIKSAFGGGSEDEYPLTDAPEGAATEEQTGDEEPSAEAPRLRRERPKTHDDELKSLLGEMEQRRQETRELMERLASLPDAVDRLARAADAQQELTGAVRGLVEQLGQGEEGDVRGVADGLRRLEEHDEEHGESLHAAVEELQRQTEMLRNVQSELAAGKETREQTTQAISQLSGAIENINRTNTSHVELIEQIRDHLSVANEGVNERLERFQSRLTTLLIAILAGLGAIFLAVIAAAAFGG